MTDSVLTDARGSVREPSTLGTGHLDALSRACGIPLRAYRADHVGDRVSRALEREGLDSVADLPGLLRRDPGARRRFRRSVAISVTGRFRDPQQYTLLRERILPDLLADRREVRVWSAGCANGLELFGVAAVLAELGAGDRAQLLGSDLLQENIDLAKNGDFDVVNPELSARTRWEVHDLVRDAMPDARFSLIVCRNVAIYLGADARERLLHDLAGTLAGDGVLLLGRSEHLADPTRYGLTAYAPHAYRRAA